MGKDRMLCPCKKVTEGDILSAMEKGSLSYKQVQKVTGAGTKCGKCEKTVRRFMDAHQPVVGEKQKRQSEPVRIRLRSAVLECADPQALASFYHQLLGGKGKVLDEGDYVEFGTKDSTILAFSRDPGYQPPAWPPAPGQVQLQAHLDFRLKRREDMPRAVAQAVALGARLAETQFGKEEFTTLIDPAGHPFCFVAEE